MVDDSFYYLEIARNLALGNGFTFDGLHRTNGMSVHQAKHDHRAMPLRYPARLVGLSPEREAL